MEMLNLGCGSCFSSEWTNIDFVSNCKEVQAHNLLKGIPFPDNSFDVVYHSHVLEHFSKNDGRKFIEECYRVLKPNGIVRIVVPDLEMIVRNYIQLLEDSIQGDKASQVNYEWILLELYDQVVRNVSGGEMERYLTNPNIQNKDFVLSRIGHEAKSFMDLDIKKIKLNSVSSLKIPKRNAFQKLLNGSYYKNLLKKILFQKEIDFFKSQSDLLQIGLFRSQGEIHQWMYDKYSLGKLLFNCGFTEIETKKGMESSIPGWERFQLEEKDGKIRKPDSLFMEANKSS